MNSLEGSVILVDVSYSDQAGSKLRPALVVSNTANNQISRDIVVAKITSKKPKFWGVRLNNEDLAAGSLDYVGYVQVDALYSLEKVNSPQRDRNGMPGKNTGNKRTNC
jgi:mRNA-degrading endonuclease toxin of MazEF toxin-antitoxin module